MSDNSYTHIDYHIRVFFIGLDQHKLQNHYLDFLLPFSLFNRIMKGQNNALKGLHFHTHPSFFIRFMVPGRSALGIINHCVFSLLVSNHVLYLPADYFSG